MFTIRKTTALDAPAIMAMIQLLAEYEKAADKVTCTAADLVRDGYGEKPLFECLIAESEGQPVGFALFFFKWSTWTGSACLHLEDVFVDPAFRGRKIGFAFLQELARIALARKCDRLEWDVLDWNMLARDFYHQIGATAKEGWLSYRLDGEALSALAKKSP